MPAMTMIEAIRDGHSVAMERDDRVVVFGEKQRRHRTSASFLSLSMSSGGVPLGATIPLKPLAS